MVLKEEQEFAFSGKQKDSAPAVSGTTVMNVQKKQHQKPLHPLSYQHQVVEVRREKGTFRGRESVEVQSTAVQ